jgi:hypothetical protein
MLEAIRVDGVRRMFVIDLSLLGKAMWLLTTGHLQVVSEDWTSRSPGLSNFNHERLTRTSHSCPGTARLIPVPPQNCCRNFLFQTMLIQNTLSSEHTVF